MATAVADGMLQVQGPSPPLSEAAPGEAAASGEATSERPSAKRKKRKKRKKTPEERAKEAAKLAAVRLIQCVYRYAWAANYPLCVRWWLTMLDSHQSLGHRYRQRLRALRVIGLRPTFQEETGHKMALGSLIRELKKHRVTVPEHVDDKMQSEVRSLACARRWALVW